MNGWPKLATRELLDYFRQWPNPWLALPDDPFDPAPWFSMPYNDVDLAAIDWTDEMRKLPGQFTPRLCFPGSPDQRIIAQAVCELTEGLMR
ncbi:hypothetical protein [Mycobacteroides salmoniphilum]|uniref:hypothetical protein n=1 Tax=Mycobacteroides salmoniphilum TaxID=404941 RepID=UPI0010662015|nr:hypothetical protein [Mycobacteroides salmoniphilum]TDZ91153.1 hypothetical protein CCUG62472_04412 [Mycobacteroides salmoniphilum]